jgi:hypothetical protein
LTGQDGSDGEPANQAKGHRPGMEQWKMRRASAEAGVKLGAALHDAANHPSVMRELDAARVARGSIACLTDEDMSSVLRDEFRPRSASCTHSTLRPRSGASSCCVSPPRPVSQAAFWLFWLLCLRLLGSMPSSPALWRLLTPAVWQRCPTRPRRTLDTQVAPTWASYLPRSMARSTLVQMVLMLRRHAPAQGQAV